MLFRDMKKAKKRKMEMCGMFEALMWLFFTLGLLVLAASFSDGL